MLFNSFVFFAFFLCVLGLYYGLRHRWQNVLLVVASYVFYGWWDWRFLSLLAISTVVDFFCGRGIERVRGEAGTARRKFLLLVSLCTNLGILGFFKYFNFFIEGFEGVLGTLGWSVSSPLLHIVLPVGISFYTFQTMAYTIDVYRGRETATRDFISFAVYVSYFPQLVAGPIERSTRLLPQITRPRRVTNRMIRTGLQLMLMGYFKKVFIADAVAPLVNDCFNDPESFGSLTRLLGVYLFALQIYGDFSGYTDIARGVSRLLGIELSVNFRQPYLSSNITEFWRRWHISLSSWLRDYLYISLGGNRLGAWKTYRNLMVTMLLGGLWHGAGWNFVIWGGLHGLYLTVHKLASRGRKIGLTGRPGSLRAWGTWLVGVLVTFNLVCFAWVFFRASGLTQALAYLQGGGASVLQGAKWPLVYVLFYGLIALVVDLSCWWDDSEVPFRSTWPAVVRGVVYAIVIVLISFVGSTDAQPFIYFQF